MEDVLTHVGLQVTGQIEVRMFRVTSEYLYLYTKLQEETTLVENVLEKQGHFFPTNQIHQIQRYVSQLETREVLEDLVDEFVGGYIASRVINTFQELDSSVILECFPKDENNNWRSYQRTSLENYRRSLLKSTFPEMIACVAFMEPRVEVEGPQLCLIARASLNIILETNARVLRDCSKWPDWHRVFDLELAFRLRVFLTLFIRFELSKKVADLEPDWPPFCTNHNLLFGESYYFIRNLIHNLF